MDPEVPLKVALPLDMVSATPADLRPIRLVDTPVSPRVPEAVRLELRLRMRPVCELAVPVKRG